MDRGAWYATVYGVAKSWTRLSDFTLVQLHLLSLARGRNPAVTIGMHLWWLTLRMLLQPEGGPCILLGDLALGPLALPGCTIFWDGVGSDLYLLTA